MPDLSFKDFKVLCEANLHKKYVAECLNIIQNGDCIYHNGFSMAHDYTTQLYDLRLKIAKDQLKDISSEKQFLEDFEYCVSNLKNSLSDEIGIAALDIDNWQYNVFYEPVNMVILGVLKGDVPWTLSDLTKKYIEDMKKGVTYEFETQYSKGKFVRDWK